MKLPISFEVDSSSTRFPGNVHIFLHLRAKHALSREFCQHSVYIARNTANTTKQNFFQKLAISKIQEMILSIFRCIEEKVVSMQPMGGFRAWKWVSKEIIRISAIEKPSKKNSSEFNRVVWVHFSVLKPRIVWFLTNLSKTTSKKVMDPALSFTWWSHFWKNCVMSDYSCLRR